MSNSNSATPGAPLTGEASYSEWLRDEASQPRGLQISAELEAAIRNWGEDTLAEFLWAAIQRNDLVAVATFTKFINGMCRDGSCE